MRITHRTILAAVMPLWGVMVAFSQSNITLTVPQLDATVTEAHGTAPVVKPLTALTAFVDAPEEVFPTLDRMTRMDMVDYFNSGSSRPSKNAFKGDAMIESADDSQVTVRTSDVSVVELSLLPKAKGDTIYMVISTLNTPAEDSSVKFYTRGWEQIEKGLFLVPGLDEWVVKDASDSREDIENAVPFVLARFTYVPSTSTLTLTNKLGEYLPEESLGLAKGSLRQSISYRWDGKKMVRVKE